jgi:integrase
MNSGTVYKRGNTWWVKVYVDGKPVYQSSKSESKTDAIDLRDRLLGKKSRGELAPASAKILIGELLDDVLKSDIAESTRYIWGLVVKKNIRPAFGKLRAASLTTRHLENYRERRKRGGASEATCNRELCVLRTALNNGRKRTPPKVHIVPHFPMRQETNVRMGFLTDGQYERLRDALPAELKALFVCSYMTGLRKSELLSAEWDWVDLKKEEISIPAHVTKTGKGRTVPIIDGDMKDMLVAAKSQRDADWPDSKFVFSRGGKSITDFRTGWSKAVTAAGIPDLTFHDLRRTAVRNMRRAGVPQVVRMQISGHQTDSMERRYNIVDGEDIAIAKKLMRRQ